MHAQSTADTPITPEREKTGPLRFCAPPSQSAPWKACAERLGYNFSEWVREAADRFYRHSLQEESSTQEMRRLMAQVSTQVHQLAYLSSDGAVQDLAQLQLAVKEAIVQLSATIEQARPVLMSAQHRATQ